MNFWNTVKLILKRINIFAFNNITTKGESNDVHFKKQLSL
jgi:hypothetical protein